MTRHEKATIRAYWQDSGYYQVQVMANGTTIARQRPGGAWGILETPFSTRRTLEALKARETHA